MNIKEFHTADYNLKFDRDSGVMVRYGKTLNDDPDMCKYGPEILDIEISAGGQCLGNCPFCYKANGGGGPVHNMTLDQFKTILGAFNLDVLTQMALGIMDLTTNPDMFNMMRHARDMDVVPNYTTHGLDMTPMFARLSRELCGVVAVSVVNKEFTYNAVNTLADAGMKQINIHYMLSRETLQGAYEVMDDIAEDPRLRKLHALVFLQYKKKGRGTNEFHSLNNIEDYQKLMDRASELGIPIGFDSCSAPMYLKCLNDEKSLSSLGVFVEPCESGLFSSYINCHGEFFPCSFMEGQPGWEKGLDVLSCDNFTDDIWMHERVDSWRDRLLSPKPKECKGCSQYKLCRVCPEFKDLKCYGGHK